MKKGFAFVLVAFIAMSMVFANGTTESASTKGSVDDTYTLSFASTVSQENSTGKLYQECFQKITERTNGHVKINESWSGTLGNEHDIGINLIDGTIDFGMVGPGEWTNYDKAFFVFDTPFLYRDYDHFYKFIATDEYKNFLKEKGDAIGMEIVVTQNQGIKGVINKVRDVYSPADLNGLKIRVPDSPSLIAVQNAMGGIASPVAASEQYMGISQGIIDGADHSLMAHVVWNLIEIAKHYTETNHALQTTYICASKKTMDKLPDEYAQIIRETFAEYQAKINADTDASNATYEQKALDAGVKIIRHSEVDEASFKAACSSIIDEFSSYAPELYSYIQSL